MKTILRLCIATGVFAFVYGAAFGQQVNPNNLPPCPKPDYSKNTDYERFAKWTNCWGRYRFEFVVGYKGDVLEGEWKNGWLNGQGIYTHANGDRYQGEFKDGKYHGQGTETFSSGDRYQGEYKDGKYHGQGTYTSANGDRYQGEIKDGNKHGQGIYTKANGTRYEGIFENDKFVREAKVNLTNFNNNIATNADRTDIDRERQQLAEERRRLEEEKRQQEQQAASDRERQRQQLAEERRRLEEEKRQQEQQAASDRERQRQQLAEERRRLDEEKRQREQQRRNERVNLQVTHTQPASDGSLTLTIQTNADTASLKINGTEEGGSVDGKYNIRRIARAGQTTTFNIVATDVYGNTDTKTITVSRAVVESKAAFAALNPENIRKQAARDAVAVVIGIADYRSLPKAEFANDDARAFYDYAIRALGIKPENIKLLVDGDAEEAEILKTFRTWLPSRVKSTTEVFVFYSGHGLPMPDGKGLYLVPPRADREVIDDTAIPFSKINAALTLAKPKSVTIFLDACYSGQARSGETLVASARPVQLKSDSRYFPENFTVITASQNDQISSSNPELQHGIFSYYLMKGMEGDADENRDGKITLAEMQSYLAENVSRHAAMMSRKQEPQLIGDVNRVLVGR